MHPSRALMAAVLLCACFVPPGCVTAPFGSAGRQGSKEVDDGEITRAVIRAFMDDEMNLLEVDVDTDDGIVYLAGEVRDYVRKIRAERVAKNVRGVKGVVNKIALEP